MIGAVLDTNALASRFVGVLKPESTPGQILRLWYQDAFVLVVSEPLLNELARVLDRRYFAGKLSPEDRLADIALLRSRGLVTSLTVAVNGVATHAEDDAILATAASAQVQYLVTGDEPFRRRVPSYRGVTLVSPRAFLQILREQVLGP